MCEAGPLVLTGGAIRREAGRLLEAAAQDAARRYIVGIAGIPASGKSTLAEQLVAEVCKLKPASAVLIPMDGYHLSNQTLARRGQLDRKGSPPTFDVDTYIETLARFRDRREAGPFQIYSRIEHRPVQSASRVEAGTSVIVAEGLYLLSTDLPWSRMAGVFNESWWLEVPIKVARQRMLERDLADGRSAEEAERKYIRNDQLNTRYIHDHRRPADRIVHWPKPPL